MLELKCTLSQPSLIQLSSQSYHVGIEIRQTHKYRRRGQRTLNRTMLELKCSFLRLSASACISLNRTMLELKSAQMENATKKHLSQSYHVGIEINFICSVYAAHPNLSIVPCWN